MDVIGIISLFVVACIAVERLMKHVKRSKCMGADIEFNTQASAPDLPGLLRR
jgi:hypothetical protein